MNKPVKRYLVYTEYFGFCIVNTTTTNNAQKKARKKLGVHGDCDYQIRVLEELCEESACDMFLND